MILYFSFLDLNQAGGLSAMLCSSWNTLWSICIRLSEGDPTSSEIIWSEFYSDCISWYEADKMFLHLTTYIGSYDHVRELFRKLDLEDCSRERLEYLSFYFDLIVFWHVLKGFYKIAGESIYKRREIANLFLRKCISSLSSWFVKEK